MKAIGLSLLLGFAAIVTGIPITPAAPEHQYLVEKLRSEGIAEHEIAQQLSFPTNNSPFRPLIHLPSDQLTARDLSGDIPPGSLEAPQMLPRAAAPESFADTMAHIFSAVWKGEDLERRKFGYEGKELELRRPVGMRHWGEQGFVFVEGAR
ncbi:hypothetical protein BDV96DRAFT_648842 [Lophiotrema nucula]|uniref:Uncharacterized protein n=1 Tax=Lophiotrema nucula TaxID=690887 RepID=A0A6A5YZN5_9PLEO|nr:hypothetical protein BDV96DRAFT_648842 [Lophiotrema nucula]